jgi:hypothetical protein
LLLGTEFEAAQLKTLGLEVIGEPPPGHRIELVTNPKALQESLRDVKTLRAGVLGIGTQALEPELRELSARRATPIAWNLAGGYQVPLTKVIELHVNTMRECVRVYAPPDAGRSV